MPTPPTPIRLSACVVLSLLAALLTSPPVLAAIEIGTTVKVVNEVSVKAGAKTLNRRLKIGDNVVYQETVSTGEASAVDIRLIDESTLIMGELSELILDRLVYDPNRGVVEGYIEVISGIIRFSTSGVKMDVTIRTPVATIGVRGTEFDVLTKATETEIAVHEGTIEVTSALGTERVTRGQFYRVNANGVGGFQAGPSPQFKTQVSLMLTLVADQGEVGQAPSSQAQSAALAATEPKAVADKDKENLLYMDLAGGRAVIELRPDLAPNHVRRVKELARQGVYDDLAFSFVRSGYAAETAIPFGRGPGSRALQQTLKAEFSEVPFERGVVGMSRKADDPDSAESQFFITLGRAETLDGKYTVIGRVIEGIELLDKLRPGRPPKNPDRIIRLRVGAGVKK